MTSATNAKSKQLLSSLMAFYEDFSLDNLSRLEELYTQDIEFVDPVHKVDGILSLKRYLKKMAANLTHYSIRYVDILSAENSAYVTWEMDFSHKSFNGGKIITVRGMSQFKFTSKVYYHEDSYDLGALIYEHIPVLGGITRSVKGRIATQAK